ncbi:MAG: hypothetical protein RID81_07020 [Sandaracinaceae bacterium]
MSDETPDETLEPGRTRADAFELERRLEYVEERLVLRLSTARVQREVAERYGVTTRTARDYIRKVRDRWNEEASTEDRVERRNHMRASVNDIFVQAMTRRVPVLERGGAPVLEEDPDGGSRPVEREEPDLKTAIRAAETLCRLDGLYDAKGAAQDVLGELGSELAAIVAAKRAREGA